MFLTIESRHVPGQAPGAPGGGTGTGTDVLEREETAAGTDARTAADRPWQVIVWNDPVNLMSYVSYVFRSYFGFSRSKADALMLQVHQDGKAIVASGGREEAERHVQAMHGYGLWATLQHSQGEGA
ncbi:ATP-dependent Clp protease adapter ClpS [Citricoccus nitrophenolicus]|uniref:ATP-dependent Clp protease adapter protein ClpS n=1 Tax=Citricoccus nitrophenolicus TaxID=863575 RepID=A0ABV0IEL0_9MICC|nr:ATP-dependent Clp protease adapter ClpS [Citricoccus sp. I39-566]WMY77009.1 ATP-dependent Clp protease adapter ClpS [Citricoccus sp. I39-566]